jgi:hypothetical protein
MPRSSDCSPSAAAVAAAAAALLSRSTAICKPTVMVPTAAPFSLTRSTCCDTAAARVVPHQHSAACGDIHAPPPVRLQAGATPLHLAVEGGHLEVVVKLVDGGVDVNTPDDVRPFDC